MVKDRKRRLQEDPPTVMAGFDESRHYGLVACIPAEGGATDADAASRSLEAVLRTAAPESVAFAGLLPQPRLDTLARLLGGLTSEGGGPALVSSLHIVVDPQLPPRMTLAGPQTPPAGSIFVPAIQARALARGCIRYNRRRRLADSEGANTGAISRGQRTGLDSMHNVAARAGLSVVMVHEVAHAAAEPAPLEGSQMPGPTATASVGEAVFVLMKQCSVDCVLIPHPRASQVMQGGDVMANDQQEAVGKAEVAQLLRGFYRQLQVGQTVYAALDRACRQEGCSRITGEGLRTWTKDMGDGVAGTKLESWLMQPRQVTPEQDRGGSDDEGEGSDGGGSAFSDGEAHSDDEAPMTAEEQKAMMELEKEKPAQKGDKPKEPKEPKEPVKRLDLRGYQQEMLDRALEEGNHITALPTGAGKTLVAAKLIHRLVQEQPTKLAIFLVDRIPLVLQQARVVSEQTGLVVGAYCGDSKARSPSVWEREMQQMDVCVVTAGLFLNLLECFDGKRQGLLTLAETCVLVFDEAHHCHSEHPYNAILRRHYFTLPKDQRPKVFGMTASPSGNISKLELEANMLSLCWNLDSAKVIMPQTHMAELLEYVEPPTTIIQGIKLSPRDELLIRGLLEHVGLVTTWLLEERLRFSPSLFKETAAKLPLDATPQEFRVEHLWRWVTAMRQKVQELKIVRTPWRLVFDYLDTVCDAYARFWDCGGDPCEVVLQEMNRALEAMLKKVATVQMSGSIQLERGFLDIARARLAIPERLMQEVGELGGPDQMVSSHSPKTGALIDLMRTFAAGWVDRGIMGGDDAEAAGPSPPKTPETPTGRKGKGKKPAKGSKAAPPAAAPRPPTLRKARTIIFVAMKRTAEAVKRILAADQVLVDEGIRGGILLGHGAFTGHSWAPEGGAKGAKAGGERNAGMSAKKQEQVLQQFRDGVFNVLIATSVGEEGLDVPACDLVVRYDPIANVAAWVQSRGRARAAGSRYVVIDRPDGSEEERRVLFEQKEQEMVSIAQQIMRGDIQVQDTVSLLARAEEEDIKKFLEDNEASGMLDDFCRRTYGQAPKIQHRKTSDSLYQAQCMLPAPEESPDATVKAVGSKRRNQAAALRSAAYRMLLLLKDRPDVRFTLERKGCVVVRKVEDGSVRIDKLGNYYCEVCQTYTTDRESLETHNQGYRHLKALGRLLDPGSRGDQRPLETPVVRLPTYKELQAAGAGGQEQKGDQTPVKQPPGTGGRSSPLPDSPASVTSAATTTDSMVHPSSDASAKTGKPAMSRLSEYIMAHNRRVQLEGGAQLTSPEYIYSAQGPAHKQTYRCTIKVGELAAEGKLVEGKKADAKESAAGRWLDLHSHS